MVCQTAEEGGTDPGDSVEPLEAAKGAVGFTICDDGTCQREPDPGEAGKLRYGGAVGIDSLAGCERPGNLHGAVAVRQGGA